MGAISFFSPQSLSSSAVPGYSAQNQTQAGATAQSQSRLQQDTVNISDEAKAKLLHKDGDSILTIASSLGTTSKTVNDYLGITLDETIAKTLEATQK
jgi:hypothetical protein